MQAALDLEPILEPGDVVLTTDDVSRVSRAIRWATRDRRRGEAATAASHVALAVTRARLPHVELIEAVGRIRHVVLGEVYPPTSRFCVWRPVNVPLEDRLDVVAAAHRDVGQRYPYGQLGLALLDSVIPGHPVFFRRMGGAITGRVYCSAGVGRWYAAAGYTFGSSWPEALTPDDIEDYVTSRPRHWRCVREWAPLSRRPPLVWPADIAAGVV